jgi:hypothetical protein
VAGWAFVLCEITISRSSSSIAYLKKSCVLRRLKILFSSGDPFCKETLSAKLFLWENLQHFEEDTTRRQRDVRGATVVLVLVEPALVLVVYFINRDDPILSLLPSPGKRPSPVPP